MQGDVNLADLVTCACACAGGGTGANPVKQIMTDLTERLPPDFIMIMIMEKVRHTYHCRNMPAEFDALRRAVQPSSLSWMYRRIRPVHVWLMPWSCLFL